jgi:hypothetical protein
VGTCRQAEGTSGLTENLLCGQMPPKDATFPLKGKPSQHAASLPAIY